MAAKEEQDEFELCKLQLKRNIEELIGTKNYTDAKKIIAEYETIVKYDQDIMRFKKRIRDAEKPAICESILVNTENKVAPLPGEDIFLTRKNVASSYSSDDVPLVSIVVVGYNNLERYTKTCVECILKYTQDVDCELILVDNGSSDGTLEYFHAVPYSRKKIVRVTKNIGAFFGGNTGIKLAEGNYIVGISNDVFVTENWLTNMLKCAYSDDRIGLIVPMSDNISNLQSVDLKFNSFSEMQMQAARFNISNPEKWHERLRLIPVLSFISRVCFDMIGVTDYGFFHDFADDDLTFRVRRAGYKAILCKDVFVQHAGSAVVKSPESLAKGRMTFKDKNFGIDAWDDVNNYEPTIMGLIKTDDKRHDKRYNILGIDILCGTPILEAKNTLREKGIFNTRISAFSREAKYWLDLKTICDGKVEVDRPEYINEYFYDEKFDYIILGKPLNAYKDPYRFLQQIVNLLATEGQLLLKLRNTHGLGTLLKILGLNSSSEHELFQHISIEDVADQLALYGFQAEDIKVEPYTLDENTQAELKQINFKTDNSYMKTVVRDYVLKIMQKH